MTTLDWSHLAKTPNAEPLARRLADFRRGVRGRFALEGAAHLLGAAVVLGLLTFVLDRTFRLSVPVRLGMLVAAVALLVVMAWREIVRPLRFKLDSLTLVQAVDGPDGALTARVASVLGLPALLAGAAPPSAAMVHQAVARSQEALARIDFRQRFDNRRRNLATTVVVASIVLPMLIALAAPATFRLWAQRLFLASHQPWPQKTYLQVAGLNDGVLVVPRGEPFALRASARAPSVVPDGVWLRYREGAGGRVTANLTAFAHNDFRYDFPGINAAVSAELWGGDDVLGPITLRPAERPKITELKLITQHPLDSKPQTYSFSGEEADLSFLPKTAMQLLFTANTPIARANIASSTTQPSAADLHMVDDRHFAIRWTQEREVRLQIELVSRDAFLTSVPTEVAIGLKIDQPPRVTLGYSGVHLRITPRATIPLAVDARDDYGVARVALATKLERPDPANPGKFEAENESLNLYGPATRPTELEIQMAHRLEVEPLKFSPGSLLTLSASATDACYTGPQTTLTRQVTFRIVAPEELFREILLRQQAGRAKFRKQTDEAHAIQHQLATTMTPAAATQLAHRFRAMQREVTSIGSALSETIMEMRLNKLATDEAYEMIQKNVQTPLKSLSDDLMNPQKDALDKLQGEDAQAVADAIERQGRIAAQMEEILKQMSQWDSFVDVLNQLNEIIRLQDQAQQNTNQMKKKQINGVFEP